MVEETREGNKWEEKEGIKGRREGGTEGEEVIMRHTLQVFTCEEDACCLFGLQRNYKWEKNLSVTASSRKHEGRSNYYNFIVIHFNLSMSLKILHRLK